MGDFARTPSTISCGVGGLGVGLGSGASCMGAELGNAQEKNRCSKLIMTFFSVSFMCWYQDSETSVCDETPFVRAELEGDEDEGVVGSCVDVPELLV